MENRFLAVDHQRVARVMTALKTDHAFGAFGENVDQLALALVSPLGADHDNVLSHVLFCSVRCN